jgi:type II secretory pathway pseudopilin PulG
LFLGGDKVLPRKYSRSSEAGFTLVEVMVATIILITALTPIVSAISRGVSLSQQAQERTIAMGLAVDYLERVKAYLPHQQSEFTIPATRQNPPQVLGDIVYIRTNPTVVSKQTQQGRLKNYNVYLTVNGGDPLTTPSQSPLPSYPLGQSYTTGSSGNGSFTYDDIAVTVTVNWFDGVSNTTKEINLTNELVGR